MAGNGKQGGSAATTFRRDEVLAVNRIFELLSRGGDATIVARSEPARSAWTKFMKMRKRLDSPVVPGDDE